MPKKTVQKPGFIVYFETMEALYEYEDDEIGMFIKNIYEFVRYGVVPEFTDRGLRGTWKLIKQALERDDQRYQKRCQKSRYASYIGVRARQLGKDAKKLVEGIDCLSFEDWVVQIDEADGSERERTDANGSECPPTTTGTSTLAELQSENKPSANRIPSRIPSGGINPKGDAGEVDGLREVYDLQAEHRRAMSQGDRNRAQTIMNTLYRLGYDIDMQTSELTRREN